MIEFYQRHGEKEIFFDTEAKEFIIEKERFKTLTGLYKTIKDRINSNKLEKGL